MVHSIQICLCKSLFYSIQYNAQKVLHHKHCEPDEQLVILLNTRKDRQDRAKQLIELIATQLNATHVALIGEPVDLVVDMALNQKIRREEIFAIGLKPTEEVFDELCNLSKSKTTIIGIGNMGAGGAELAKYVENSKYKNV